MDLICTFVDDSNARIDRKRRANRRSKPPIPCAIDRSPCLDLDVYPIGVDA